jgi:hypothetical protein
MSCLDLGAVTVAYNDAHTRVALAGEGGLAIAQRQPGSKRWSQQGSLPPVDTLRLTALCWAPTELGAMIAGGASDGSVVLWQEAPGKADMWRLLVTLREATLAVQGLAFAPTELGPQLAVAYADGFVR